MRRPTREGGRGSPAGRRRLARQARPVDAEIVIDRLGRQGDGIGSFEAGPVHVPLTLPGDRVRARVGAGPNGARHGAVEQWLDRAPRHPAACRHFGTCGGCRLQHLSPATYADWILATVTAALRSHRLAEVPVRRPAITPPGTRRRVRLAFLRRGSEVSLGFRALASQRIVGITECPVATPSIVRLVPPLRELLAFLEDGRDEGEVVITELAGGLDVMLTRRDPPTLGEREHLIAFAERADVARLSVAPDARTDPEPVVQRRAPSARFAGIDVRPPPGAFLQASVAAETWIREAVDEAVGLTSDLLDLFSGCGTFGLPQAARGARLHAIDSAGALLAALDDAARRAGLGDRIRTERRDLDRRPLRTQELRQFAAAIIDPPRSGAAAQARALAASAVPRVAMVSCNPGTFARDARILVDGGYQLLWVQPVDPFLWSAELEVVGAFARRPPSPSPGRGLIHHRAPST